MKTSFRWRHFLIEPYRIFFATGAIWAILSIGFWFTYLHAMGHGLVLFDWQQIPQYLHSHVMIYGVINFYVFGFILTAFPRFVDQPHPRPSFLIFLWGLLLFSQIFFILGSFQNPVWFKVAAVLEPLSIFVLFLFLLLRYLRSGKIRQDRQPIFILIALLFGTLGSTLSYFFYAWGQGIRFYEWSIEIGTYGFLLFLVVSITYRIVPFFTGRVVQDYQPHRGKFTLQLVLALIVLYLGFHLIPTNPKLTHYASWILNLIFLILLANEWRQWIPKNPRQAPMLFVLYLGLFWVLVFFAFSGYELLAHLLRIDPPSFPFFRTPALHALYIGAFGTLLVGISTRVARGHGGLPIVADRWMLVAILSIQVTALLRVGLPILDSLWPGLRVQNYWAGLFWCLAFSLWLWRYFRVLGQPKAVPA